MKINTLLVYRIVTVLFSLSMLAGAAQYVFTYDVAQEMFNALGFPTYIIYPLGAAKVLGVIAIWTNISPRLKEWAYAGYTFNFLLAGLAHLSVGDGQFWGALIALILSSSSYFLYRKLEAQKA
ncbi:DoxX family protein [bacterium SCSIO 12741]|nr:DoxX family protein [bacterium SCSIO 12741]